jgi:aquaporin Z
VSHTIRETIMKKLLTEFLGTFFLVLIIGMAVTGAVAMPPLAIGVGLAVLVYMGGHVSGAHYNPAVSTAALLRGKLPAADFVPYVVAQVLGSLAGAAMVHVIVGQTFAPAPAVGVGILAPLLIEVLFTFLLVLVVLNVATHPATKGNSYYGLAIGGAVMAGAFVGGGLSGGAFNPAVGIGPIVVHAVTGGGSFANLWLYLVGPMVGGVLAAVVYGVQEQPE